MKNHLNIIKKCPLFADIEEEHLLTMLNCLGAKIIFFDKKQTIIEESSSARYIYVLLSGSVQIFLIDYDGNRSILSKIEASGVFGEEFAVTQTEYVPVSVVADEACEIMQLDCAHIMKKCENNCSFHNKLIFNLMRDLAEKTIHYHQRVEVTSKRTTREKLLTYLTIKSKEAGNNSFQIPFDRQELADYLEVDRSGLSAEISKLRSEGIITSTKNRFKFL